MLHRSRNASCHRGRTQQARIVRGASGGGALSVTPALQEWVRRRVVGRCREHSTWDENVERTSYPTLREYLVSSACSRLPHYLRLPELEPIGQHHRRPQVRLFAHHPSEFARSKHGRGTYSVQSRACKGEECRKNTMLNYVVPHRRKYHVRPRFSF